MDRDQAKLVIKKEWRKLIEEITQPALQKVNDKTSYVCPLCGHGKGGDGLTLNPQSKVYGLKCFGCDFEGDIIQLYMEKTGKKYNDVLHSLAGKLGITIDPYNKAAAAERSDPQQFDKNSPYSAENATDDRTHTEQHSTLQMTSNNRIEGTSDFTAYYRECRDRLNCPEAVSYLSARGISFDTAWNHWIGFDPKADPAHIPGKTVDWSNWQKFYTPIPRIILPTTKSHYIGRAIVDDDQVIGEHTKPDGSKEKYDYRKMNPQRKKGAGATGIFNKSALYAQDVQVVFVTEGAFDALSVIEAGAAAIALNSTSNVNLLLSELENKPTAATLVLCLDNDGPGGKASEKLKEGLDGLNVKYFEADICGDYKDPNEHLVNNRETFFLAVKTQMNAAARPHNISYYLTSLFEKDIERFKSEIKTGYANLDSQAGGLYAGLYVIAAISSLGKTTFSAQMADQIAAAGNDVLFFSMEQSRLEIVSKSIARKAYLQNPDTEITSLNIRKGCNKDEVKKIAAAYMKDVGDRLSIIEGNFNYNISFIRESVREYIVRNKVKPVVFIDYLQVLQPQLTNNRVQSVRESIDSSVTELKRLSRDLDITIFVISSVNRANYLTPIDFESLKESGNIEYTADVVWGLQLQCVKGLNPNDVKGSRDSIKKAKAATPRKIELVCLKNRYGISSFEAQFDYYPAHDCFKPGDGKETASQSQPKVLCFRKQYGK